MSRRLKLRLLLGLFAILFIGGAAVWLFGPRETVDATVRFDAASIGRDPQAYLAAEESEVPGITEETAKEVVWAYPASRAKTPLAIVYIHGYSADKRELRPVPDQVAEALGANLFYTRLSGHGSDLAALAEPSANDWLNDFAEAVAIGRQIGERVIVMSTSTGGTLTAWAASLGLTEGVNAFVMVSPNFRLADWRAPLLTMPFARAIVPLVYPSRQLELVKPAPDGSRTANFPTIALLPMAALVETVRGIDFSAITTPTLFIYSQQDQVVDPAATASVIERWGGPKEVLLAPETEDPLGHMLAGDLFSPSTTEAVAGAVTAWIEGLQPRP